MWALDKWYVNIWILLCLDIIYYNNRCQVYLQSKYLLDISVRYQSTNLLYAFIAVEYKLVYIQMFHSVLPDFILTDIILGAEEPIDCRNICNFEECQNIEKCGNTSNVIRNLVWCAREIIHNIFQTSEMGPESTLNFTLRVTHFGVYMYILQITDTADVNKCTIENWHFYSREKVTEIDYFCI